MLTSQTPSRPRAAAPNTDQARLVQLLTDLYKQQFALTPNSEYLHTHGNPKAIRNHVHNFLWYRPFLPPMRTVLDWGCNHAPDSCLLRASFGDQLELHGCDFRPPDAFPPFFEYADLQFTRLNDNVVLPYADEFFDVVIGSGTLEHTAMDYESLKQLYRVLRPNGVLVITYLPNHWSIQEYMRRRNGQPCHKRLYRLTEACQLLKRTGFFPLAAEHQMWDGMLARFGPRSRLRQVLRRFFPVHRFASTLRLVAKKMRSM